MKNTNLFLPGFHLSTLRKKPKSKAQKLADQLDKLKKHSISQLGEYFHRFIPKHYLENNQQGKFSRLRLFSKSNTFWAFFSQILDADGGCKEAVRKTQAYMASKLKTLPSNSSSAYCQARCHLDISSLESIFSNTTQLHHKSDGWKGHRVVVVDGTGLSMPDTQANQEVFPQQKTQKPGCGFPQARVCAYFDINEFNNLGVDSVVTQSKRIPKSESQALKTLGKDDLLVQWEKPHQYSKASSYTREQWQNLPKTLTLRQIKGTVQNSGFRIKSFYIITTLLDSDQYRTSDIADLYYQRWDVELFFRDIKSTMGMDILRCKTPQMINKEILMHLIVYNCIRSLMVEAAIKINIAPRLISFKETMQALRGWQQIIDFTQNSQQEITRIKQLLYEVIANSKLCQRLGRTEPRCVKRRPKNHQLMTAPRDQMKELPHRGKKRAKGA